MRQYEEEFERRLRAHANDSRACAIFAYTELAVHARAGADAETFNRINAHAGFWNGVLASLQTAAFVALGRMYDQDGGNDNAPELLRYAQRYRGIFTRPALTARRVRQGMTPLDAQRFASDAFEPSAASFAPLRDALDVQRRIYVAKVQAIRHEVFAHKGRIAREKLNAMFTNVSIREFEGLVVFGLQLDRALDGLYTNGIEPTIEPVESIVGNLIAEPVPPRMSTWEHRHVVTDTSHFLDTLPLPDDEGDEIDRFLDAQRQDEEQANEQ